MMTFQQATDRYEAWLARHTTLVKGDVRRKHREMKHDAFSFLRATFYRWMHVWPNVCATLASAPHVLAVGDLHVANFGTWRDSEGRLTWGINDFDEACTLPYTNDLVRLAVSARLAIRAGHLTIKPKEAYDAVVLGYTESLKSGGRPFVLAEQHRWLRAIATSQSRNHIQFWKKLAALPVVRGPVPHAVSKALESMLPEPGLPYTLRHRTSGLGSLGRPRFVALADWKGGNIAREAKALVPSSCVWANTSHTSTLMYQTILDQAVRCRDPFVQVREHWLVRRLSPYCSRIELTSLPKTRDENRLLYAMGWETANVHLGSRTAIKSVLQDLKARKANWLREAAKDMLHATLTEWAEWTRT